jgi:hypothetical protein
MMRSQDIPESVFLVQCFLRRRHSVRSGILRQGALASHHLVESEWAAVQQKPSKPGSLKKLRGESEEACDPLHIGFLGAQSIMFNPQNLPHLIKQFGLWVRQDECSLCRTRFRGHIRRNSNNRRNKGNKNPLKTSRGYTAFSLPNTC